MNNSPWMADSGHTLYFAGQQGQVLRLVSGAVRLDGHTDDGLVFVQLALPGDLLGSELQADLPYAFTARAVVPCVIRREPMLTPHTQGEAWRQQHRRCVEALRLRTGPAPQRLRALLLLLSASTDVADGSDQVLPTLRDMAAMIDSAPETVSRILGGLRRCDVLQERQRKGARFDRDHLRDCALPQGLTRSVRSSTTIELQLAASVA